MLHEKRTSKCTKRLSDIDKLNVDAKLITAKKAHIKITHEKNCAVCHRKIGELKVFAVYPNGVIAHHKCVGIENQNVCPLTKQNFLKNFKF